ncbi:MAG: agmatine deiminase family protein [Bacteroidaceae bacterium]|nr:agmatine deiminase family protein [Bacteroidaceae bacterium]
MALQFKVNTPTVSDLTLHLQMSGLPPTEDTELRQTFFPAEWFPQCAVQLTWPHAGTDWHDYLQEVDDCYVRIALEILIRGEKMIIVTPEPERVKMLMHQRLPSRLLASIIYFECNTNDTWARDHSFLTLMTEHGPKLLDFRFNGWGQKFASNHDNMICRRMMARVGEETEPLLKGDYEAHLDFTFEGGSIESDGHGTLLTTTECLMAPNRNEPLLQQEIEECMLKWFHAERVLWLDYGYLAGDDTDSHVDTLARFCSSDTIAYVSCDNPDDEHYESLKAMERQLQSFRTTKDQPYNLVPLPLPAPMLDPDDGHRLPATYANFLIINRAVLMPTYGQPDIDALAERQLSKAFPRHDIVPIDCSILIRQHGSLHCSTMQYPIGVL